MFFSLIGDNYDDESQIGPTFEGEAYLDRKKKFVEFEYHKLFIDSIFYAFMKMDWHIYGNRCNSDIFYFYDFNNKKKKQYEALRNLFKRIFSEYFNNFDKEDYIKELHAKHFTESKIARFIEKKIADFIGEINKK